MTYAHHIWRKTDRPTVCLQNGEEEEEWDRFSRFNREGSAVHENLHKGSGRGHWSRWRMYADRDRLRLQDRVRTF